MSIPFFKSPEMFKLLLSFSHCYAPTGILVANFISEIAIKARWMAIEVIEITILLLDPSRGFLKNFTYDSVHKILL
jgi:hypothetical protein